MLSFLLRRYRKLRLLLKPEKGRKRRGKSNSLSQKIMSSCEEYFLQIEFSRNGNFRDFRFIHEKRKKKSKSLWYLQTTEVPLPLLNQMKKKTWRLKDWRKCLPNLWTKILFIGTIRREKKEGKCFSLPIFFFLNFCTFQRKLLLLSFSLMNVSPFPSFCPIL